MKKATGILFFFACVFSTVFAVEFGDIEADYPLYTDADPFAISKATNAFTVATNEIQLRVSGDLASSNHVAAATNAVTVATDNKLAAKMNIWNGTSYTQTLFNATVTNKLAFGTNYSTALAVGEIAWDPDWQTFRAGLPDGVTGQFFQESQIYAKNASGQIITNGMAVMQSDAVGNSGKIEITLALASVGARSSMTLGVATHDIAVGAFGKITWFGNVNEIDTTGALYGESGWTNNMPVYVSTNKPGFLTKFEPKAPYPRIVAGSVINAHANTGNILVRPTWGMRLADLDDVDGTPLTATGQFPVYDSVRGVFDFDRNVNEFMSADEKINELYASDDDAYVSVNPYDGMFYASYLPKTFSGFEVTSPLVSGKEVILAAGYYPISSLPFPLPTDGISRDGFFMQAEALEGQPAKYYLTFVTNGVTLKETNAPNGMLSGTHTLTIYSGGTNGTIVLSADPMPLRSVKSYYLLSQSQKDYLNSIPEVFTNHFNDADPHQGRFVKLTGGTATNLTIEGGNVSGDILIGAQAITNAILDQMTMHPTFAQTTNIVQSVGGGVGSSSIVKPVVTSATNVVVTSTQSVYSVALTVASNVGVDFSNLALGGVSNATMTLYLDCQSTQALASVFNTNSVTFDMPWEPTVTGRYEIAVSSDGVRTKARQAWPKNDTPQFGYVKYNYVGTSSTHPSLSVIADGATNGAVYTWVSCPNCWYAVRAQFSGGNEGDTVTFGYYRFVLGAADFISPSIARTIVNPGTPYGFSSGWVIVPPPTPIWLGGAGFANGVGLWVTRSSSATLIRGTVLEVRKANELEIKAAQAMGY